MKIEVTKVKEKLEKLLSLSNEILKNIKIINKGIKLLEKEDKNIIKILSYVSKMNKNQKEMKKLFEQIMKSIRISFNEKECNIKYEEYIFNGIPSPKDIEIKEMLS